MARITPIRVVSVTIVLAAALAGLLFVFVFGGDGTKGPFPGISLGLTAEASGLMSPGAAFPSTQAGQSSYVTGVAQIATSGDITRTVDSILANFDGSRMSEVFVNNMGDNFALVILRVPNINGMTGTEPHVYIDTDGRVVAFFLNTQNAGALMQWDVVSDIESGAFQPGGVNTTVLLDAVRNTLLAAGLAGDALNTRMDEVKHFNFEFSDATFDNLATNLLLLANTKGDVGEEVATFAVRASWKIYEVSWAGYNVIATSYYTNLYLDGSQLYRNYSDWIVNGQVGVGAFDLRASHSYKIVREREYTGADSSGLAFVILYRP